MKKPTLVSLVSPPFLLICNFEMIHYYIHQEGKLSVIWVFGFPE